MPYIQTRLYTASVRKHLMIPFGMYRAEATGPADVQQIEDADDTQVLGITGAQNGVNTVFGLSAAPSFARVLLNGHVLTEIADYLLIGSTLTLTTAPSALDILRVFSYPGDFVAGSGGGGIGSVGDQYFVASAGQTTFTPSFVIGAPWVFVNGMKQRLSVDYTVSLGSVHLSFPCDAGWIVEIVQ